MEADFGRNSLGITRLDVLVHQIMKTFRIDAAEATAMALGMFFEEFIIAASIAIGASEQAQVVA